MSVRFAYWLVLCCCTAAWLSAPASAQNMSSESFELRSGTLSGGGGVGLQGPSGVTLGGTLGPSSPLGIARGPSGITLESGFWPTAATPVPEPDGAILALGLWVLIGAARRRGRAEV